MSVTASALRRAICILLPVLGVALPSVDASPAETDARAAPDRFHFRFAPPSGTRLIETRVTVVEKSFQGVPAQRDRTELRTEYSYEPTDEGYRVTARTLGLSMMRDGESVRDPMAEIMARRVITYRIDSQGQVRSIGGIAGVLDEVRDEYPPQIANALVQAISEEAIAAHLKSSWDERIGQFAGIDFEIGDVIDVNVPFVLPNGERMTHHHRASFPRREACAAGSCVRVETVYDSDARARRALADGEPEPEAQGGAPLPPVASGTATRLVDPETMLVYDEESTRTVNLTVAVPGGGSAPVRVVETRSYAFEYAPASEVDPTP